MILLSSTSLLKTLLSNILTCCCCCCQCCCWWCCCYCCRWSSSCSCWRCCCWRCHCRRCCCCCCVVRRSHCIFIAIIAFEIKRLSLYVCPLILFLCLFFCQFCLKDSLLYYSSFPKCIFDCGREWWVASIEKRLSLLWEHFLLFSKECS